MRVEPTANLMRIGRHMHRPLLKTRPRRVLGSTMMHREGLLSSFKILCALACSCSKRV